MIFFPSIVYVSSVKVMIYNIHKQKMELICLLWLFKGVEEDNQNQTQNVSIFHCLFTISVYLKQNGHLYYI